MTDYPPESDFDFRHDSRPERKSLAIPAPASCNQRCLLGHCDCKRTPSPDSDAINNPVRVPSGTQGPDKVITIGPYTDADGLTVSGEVAGSTIVPEAFKGPGPRIVGHVGPELHGVAVGDIFTGTLSDGAGNSITGRFRFLSPDEKDEPNRTVTAEKANFPGAIAKFYGQPKR